jgi:hydrogenase maturation protein HypF
LLCNQKSFSFKRLAHLEKQPLIGGDLATRHPLRTAAGILSRRIDIKDWLLQNKQHFPHGEKEIEVILNQLGKSHDLVETTSCGRVLDAVAAILDTCYERTYEGEPAMKLESVALEGKDVLKLEPVIRNDVLETTQLLHEIFEKRKKHSKADLAYSVHVYIAKGLAELAIRKSLENDIKAVGFSGGVACNKILASIIRKTVEASDLQFLVHEVVPPGDGGVSFGQTVAVGFSQN